MDALGTTLLQVNKATNLKELIERLTELASYYPPETVVETQKSLDVTIQLYESRLSDASRVYSVILR